MLWLLILVILTIINFFIWIYRLYFFKNRLKIVNELLPNYVIDLIYPIQDNKIKLVQSKFNLLEIENLDVRALEDLKNTTEKIISKEKSENENNTNNKKKVYL